MRCSTMREEGATLTLGATLKYQLHHLQLSAVHRGQQRRLARCTRGIDVESPLLAQDVHNLRHLGLVLVEDGRARLKVACDTCMM